MNDESKMNAEKFKETCKRLSDRYEELQKTITENFNDAGDNLLNDIVSRDDIEKLGRQISLLKQPDLNITFLGTVGVGKSTSMNALYGYDLLQDKSGEATTLVPTFIRVRDYTGDSNLKIEPHYRSLEEFTELEEKLNLKIKENFNMQNENNLQENIKNLNPNSDEEKNLLATCTKYVEIKNKKSYSTPLNDHSDTIEFLQKITTDPTCMLKLHHVNVTIKPSALNGVAIDPDIVLIDMPGVNEIHPFHDDIVVDFLVGEKAASHGSIFLLSSQQANSLPVSRLLALYKEHRGNLKDILNVYNINSHQGTRIDMRSNSGIILHFEFDALYGLLAQLFLHNPNAGSNERINNMTGRGFADAVTAKMAKSRIEKPGSSEETLHTEALEKILEESEIPKFRKHLTEEYVPTLRNNVVKNAQTWTDGFYSKVTKSIDTKLAQLNNDIANRESRTTEVQLEKKEAALDDLNTQIKNLIKFDQYKKIIFELLDTRKENTMKKEKFESFIKKIEAKDIKNDIARENGIGALAAREKTYPYEIENKAVDILNKQIKADFMKGLQDCIKSELNQKISKSVIMELNSSSLQFSYDIINDTLLNKLNTKNEKVADYIALSTVGDEVAKLDDIVSAPFLKSAETFNNISTHNNGTVSEENPNDVKDLIEGTYKYIFIEKLKVTKKTNVEDLLKGIKDFKNKLVDKFGISHKKLIEDTYQNIFGENQKLTKKTINDLLNLVKIFKEELVKGVSETSSTPSHEGNTPDNKTIEEWFETFQNLRKESAEEKKLSEKTRILQEAFKNPYMNMVGAFFDKTLNDIFGIMENSSNSPADMVLSSRALTDVSNLYDDIQKLLKGHLAGAVYSNSSTEIDHIKSLKNKHDQYKNLLEEIRKACPCEGCSRIPHLECVIIDAGTLPV